MGGEDVVNQCLELLKAVINNGTLIITVQEGWAHLQGWLNGRGNNGKVHGDKRQLSDDAEDHWTTFERLLHDVSAFVSPRRAGEGKRRSGQGGGSVYVFLAVVSVGYLIPTNQ